MNCSFPSLSHARRNRIVPREKNPTIEIRPSRYLRIQHFNAQPRDEKFDNEMYSQYKQMGISEAGNNVVSTKYRNNNHRENVIDHNDSLSQSIAGQAPISDKPQISNEKTVIPDTNRSKDIVIFFFHGVGGSSDVWQAQTRYFSDLGYEIVAPDLIGHGCSCTVKDASAYHFREIAADVEETFIRYCKRKNVLIGHSYGSSFAALLARNHSRLVLKLILISGGSPTPLMPQQGVFSLPYCVLACIKPCLFSKFYRDAFYKKCTPVIPKEEAFNIPTYVLQHTMNGQEWPDGDEFYYEWITCPSLLIYGAQDKLVSLEEEEKMARVIYNSHLEVIEDAGHMVMIEASDTVNHLINEFISK